MGAAEFMGMLVTGLAGLGGLIVLVGKPLNANTKAMTVLTIRVEQLTKKLDKTDLDMLEYKEHMKDSQKRQWDVLDKHSQKLMLQEIEIKNLKERGTKQ